MKIINKKSYILAICVIFTATVLIKVISEAIFWSEFGHYSLNIVGILLFSALTAFVLMVHDKLFRLPLLLAVLIQYFLVVLSMLFFIWMTGWFLELATYAYRDVFVSISILYIIASIIYYIFFYIDLKRHNHILQKLKQIKKKH